MISFEYTVTDENGIHARPAGVLVSEAKKYESTVTLSTGERTADAKRLFAVMGLGASKGDVLTVSAEGGDEKDAANGLRHAMETAGL